MNGMKNKLNLNLLLHGLTISVDSESMNIQLKLVGEVEEMTGRSSLLVEIRTSNGRKIHKKLILVENLDEIHRLLPRNITGTSIRDVERMADVKNPLNKNLLSEDLRMFHMGCE